MGVLDDYQRLLGAAGVPVAPLEDAPTRLMTGGALGQPGQPAGWTQPDYVLNYMQDMLSGKIANQGALGARYQEDPDNPLGRVMDIAMGVGPGAIRAWHASPYDFNKFDISKIGTGQGAQSYGHGIYAAESPAVSGKGGQYDLEFTAKNLGKYDLNPGELQIHRMLRADRSDMDILDELAKGGGYTFDEAVAALDRVKAAKAKIYEVDIHADPKAFLDWDRPLAAQPDILEKLQNQTSLRTPLYMSERPGQEIYQSLLQGARPTTLSEIARGGPDARVVVPEKLNELGIPGIRYLDQGSRGAGTGTSNYAVFDDSIIQILRKYGIIPPAVATGGLLATGEEPPT